MFGVDTEHMDTGVREGRPHNMYAGVVVIVATIFLLLSLPTVVVNIIEYSQPAWVLSHQKYAQLYLMSVLCQNLICLNHAAAHAIYFACVSPLRHQLWILFHASRNDSGMQGSEDGIGRFLNENEIHTEPMITTTV
jgi:hypothetical protein